MDFPWGSVAIFYNVGRIISSYTGVNPFWFERSGYSRCTGFRYIHVFDHLNNTALLPIIAG